MNTFSLPTFQKAELLKRTTSRCPQCHRACPAEVWREMGTPSKVFLKRTCPAHGEASACIASDARFYWLAKGAPENSCCGTGPSNCCSPPNGSTPSSGVQLLKGNAFSAADYSVAGTLGRNAGGKGDAPFEKLSTCLALIEIVNSCNLACPTCYADSPVGVGHAVDAVPLAELKTRIQGVIDRKGDIEILQLSGGEPTLHPQFFELLDWAQQNPGIDYLLLNTNGLRIAQDEEFAQRLAERVRRRRLQLYLQFDGVQLAGQHTLRGADLRAIRQRAIDRCAEMDLPITLAMTVTAENIGHLWEAIEFGLRYPHIRGISFQPVFGSGRGIQPARPMFPSRRNLEITEERSSSPSPREERAGRGAALNLTDDNGLMLSPSAFPGLDQAASPPQPSPPFGMEEREKKGAPSTDSWSDFNSEESSNERELGTSLLSPALSSILNGREGGEARLNTANIILASVEQSEGKLRFEDFTPLPCGDPNCATIGYLLKVNGQTQSVSDFIDFTQVQGFLHDKVRYRLEDLMKCGCESEPLGELLKKFELDESNTFRLFIKPFMDAWTWDEDRIDRCCTHVIRPDGKLDSFCRYYSGFADARKAP